MERIGGCYLSKDDIEADDSWTFGDYDPTFEQMIEKAEMIHGIPFAPLSEVLKWKLAFGRPKDIADVQLIQAYLKG